MLCNITQNAMGQTLGGVPVSHNALQHFPECHGAHTWGGYPARSSWGGGYPARGVPCQGVPPARSGQDGGVPWQGGYPGRVAPSPQPGQDGLGGTLAGGGYPGRTTEGVLTTRRAVCLLCSRRRTFLFE